MDPQINTIQTREAQIWDQATGHSYTYVVMTYKIGTHGPFTYKVPLAQFNSADALAAMNAMLATLRSLNAVPPAA